ncbi:uncharacterized protein F5147DRAFT_777272 [Suillus discolor]|uniref:Uncharacterized protein n=1 Tax=Suillus discolor TaxID=1912936 RepID=A0A9P7JQQ3_9AGAM|nr:uncharacterized protein F5147DRAFT_777272 [Suillus discolor]KAG2099578.1 hypothetical protein F5147DRAFT_777272 [Suillus discolor]
MTNDRSTIYRPHFFSTLIPNILVSCLRYRTVPSDLLDDNEYHSRQPVTHIRPSSITSSQLPT